MLDCLTRHPRTVGETYAQHLATALCFGGTMIAAGCACVIHALLPFLFESTASRCVERLHQRMSARAARRTQGAGGDMASTSPV